MVDRLWLYVERTDGSRYVEEEIRADVPDAANIIDRLAWRKYLSKPSVIGANVVRVTGRSAGYRRR